MYKIDLYSKKTEGNVMVARNFKASEFACQDGSDIILIDPLLVWILQNVRDHFGKPVNITSGYRTPAHNAKLPEASSGSYHLQGRAADFTVTGVKAEEVQAYLESIMPNTGGIGKASTYTHVDTRETKSRWTY